jgi:UDP-N-acetylmuramate--alanine ligase
MASNLPLTNGFNIASLSPEGKSWHFVGIGGIGMSGLAKMLLKNGIKVSGSDASDSPVINALLKLGADVKIGHSSVNIPDNTHSVVVSAAIKPENPEYQRAVQMGLKIYKYAQMLGKVMAAYDGVAVSGTHGKSTTSGWLSFLLTKAGFAPNWIVGADIVQLGDSNGVGNGRFFVAESCEYDRSFLNLSPKIGVILNIEQDHLDYYKDEADIIDAFADFAANIRDEGVIIANGTDINVQRALEKASKKLAATKHYKIETFGYGTNAAFSARNISDNQGLSEFDIYHYDNFLGRATISLPGHHNVLNALAVVGAAVNLGVEPAKIIEILPQFTGMDRRLMLKAQQNDITIVDDYAHHPTEIRASLRAIRERYNPRRLICVFEPHQYSRTRFLLDDFAQSFKLADITIVPEIYFVRDTEQMKQQVNAQILVERITGRGSTAIFLPGFDNIVEYLKHNVKQGDLVVTMGAGNIWKVADEYIQWLGRNS